MQQLLLILQELESEDHEDDNLLHTPQADPADSNPCRIPLLRSGCFSLGDFYCCLCR